MKIEIEISQFHHDVLAHNQSDVNAFFQEMVTREANIQARHLADQEIQTALNNPKANPKISMDRETIVKAKFAKPGYKNAAGR